MKILNSIKKLFTYKVTQKNIIPICVALLVVVLVVILAFDLIIQAALD